MTYDVPGNGTQRMLELGNDVLHKQQRFAIHVNKVVTLFLNHQVTNDNLVPKLDKSAIDLGATTPCVQQRVLINGQLVNVKFLRGVCVERLNCEVVGNNGSKGLVNVLKLFA